MDEMEEACSSTVQAHDVDSARQMIQQHQDLKKRNLSTLLSLCSSFCPQAYSKPGISLGGGLGTEVP